jgi:hypothetical protein
MMETKELLHELNEGDYKVKEAIDHPEITQDEPEWFNQDEFYINGIPSPGFHNDQLLIRFGRDGWKAVGSEYDGRWKR